MITEHNAQSHPTQPTLDAIPETVLVELWEQYQSDVADCVAAARPVVDEPMPMRWDVAGIDHLGLRGIVRCVRAVGMAQVDTIWLRNYPGLRAAIPDRGLVRRPGFAEGDRGIGDDELCREFVLTILGRGRGLRERGRALVRELCEGRCLGVRYFERRDGVHMSPARFTPAERAAMSRSPLSGTQWRILETLAFARGPMRKLGLWGECASWGRLFGVDERTIRRAMTGLEELGLAWRHYTPTEGTANRIVDQAPNIIVPGPEWMRVDGLWTGDDQGDAREHWGDVARMRNHETRERQKFVRACKRARAAGEPLPVPPGGHPLAFEEWVRERLLAEGTVAGARDQIERLDHKSADVALADARAVASGQSTPLQAFVDGAAGRKDSREALSAERREVTAPVTAEALNRIPDGLEVLRTVPSSELAELAVRASDASVKRPLYSRLRADILSAPPQAESSGQRGTGAHASPVRVAALRAGLRKRFGGCIKSVGWGNARGAPPPSESPPPSKASKLGSPTERASERLTQSTPNEEASDGLTRVLESAAADGNEFAALFFGSAASTANKRDKKS